MTIRNCIAKSTMLPAIQNEIQWGTFVMMGQAREAVWQIGLGQWYLAISISGTHRFFNSNEKGWGVLEVETAWVLLKIMFGKIWTTKRIVLEAVIWSTEGYKLNNCCIYENRKVLSKNRIDLFWKSYKMATTGFRESNQGRRIYEYQFCSRLLVGSYGLVVLPK